MPRESNLEREREGHDDIRDHNVLQVYDEVRLGGDAEKHPHRHGVEQKPQQEEKRVEDGKHHRLQNIVTGTSGVGVAVIGGEHGWGSGISLHECFLKKYKQSEVKITQKTNKR